MRSIAVWCLVVAFAVLGVAGCKCESEKPKDPTVVEKPRPALAPTALPVILKVLKTEGGWEVTINRKAEEMVRKGQAEVRLHIGYCWYAGDVKTNKVVFRPDWHPGGRVSVGIWQLSGGKYLSSALVSSAEPIRQVAEKIEQVTPLPPPPSEITPEEAIKRLRSEQPKPEQPKPEQPKPEQPNSGLVTDDANPEIIKIESEACKSADSLKNTW